MNQKKLAKFKALENERVAVSQRAYEMKGEMKETRLVLDTLEKVDKGRKCYRMVGGVLVERTVEEVTTALTKHYDQVTKTADAMSNKLADVEKQLTEIQNELRDTSS